MNGSYGNDSWDGQTWEKAKLTIQNATGTVSSNGVVTIADGVYSGSGNTNITINRNMIIQGLSQNGTIINGTDTNWIFTILSGVNVTIRNLTFTNGIAYNGGAILNNGILSISDCTFTANTATNWGGAIYSNSDEDKNVMSLTDCTFTNNTALHGGGAIAYRNICNVTNCTFMYNSVTGDSSWCGGAIGAYQGSNSTVTGCTFVGNSVDPISSSFGGGAIYVYAATLTANFNRFYNNSASLGNALAYNTNGNIKINAENNWWGSNVDPTTVPNLIYGPVDANPWVILTVNATPSTINNGETSAITADFNHINGGGDLVGGHIPDGPITLNIPWGSFTNSGTSHSLSANTVAGVLSATFYATEGALNPLFNPVKVTATADGYTTSNLESAYISINPAAYMNITTTVNVTSANVGDLIRYNITITNNGPDNVTSIALEDILPLENGQVPEYVSLPPDSLTYIPEGAKLTWTNILDSFGGILQPGHAISVLIDVRIPSSAAGTIFTNKANITSNVYPYFNETTANVFVNQATVELDKTANNTRPNVGETVLFTIVAKNNGPSTASNLIVTDTLPTGLDFVNCTGGGVWDPVTRTVTWPAAIVANNGNITYYLTALVNSTSLAGTNITNVVNETHAEYPNNSTTNCTIYVPKADLYVQITSDKNNPTVGETFTLRYKLGNNGPDDATNVTITIPLPEGFVISKIEGDGNWTVTGNTITWTMTNVTVGDPNLYISGWTTGIGNYLFTASIATDTFSINSRGVSPLTLNAQPTVNAATTTSTTSGNTVGMQSTGAPVVPLALAVLSILGGLTATRKKQ
nr:hypothetical protein [uncultured Methanobacterium sp.]